MRYERTNIQDLAPYVPGEQPAMDPKRRIIKLNTNENPYLPAKQVLLAIQTVTGDALRRYPQPQADRFRATAARVHGLSPNQIIATNGGDELLRLALTVFCEPRPATTPDPATPPTGGIGFGVPSYSLYQVLAQIQDTPVTTVPLGNANDEFALPNNFAARLNDAGCRLAIVVNPHAPSGRLETVNRLEALAREFRGVLVVDEAYVDFASHDALGLLSPDKGLKNVLLLRTLSKGYSLAGLRFGYGLGHPHLIEALDKARDSYNTDAVSQRAAEAALTAGAEASKTWHAVVEERTRLTQALKDRGFTVYPSQANFILVVPPTDARTMYERLAQQAIYVRYFDQERLSDKLRITIGRPDDNDVLLAALDELA